MMVLETMYSSMLSIINDGPHDPMYQPIKENVKEGDIVKKHAHEFDDEYKHLVVLYVKDRATIGNTLPYDIYHFVQN